MATQEKLNSVSSELRRIPEITNTCHDIALALIEANEKVSYAGTILAFIARTDYDRARRQIIAKCSSTLRGLKAIRRTALSPDAIRAGTRLRSVLKYCRMCPAENLKNMSEGKSFHCLVKTASENNTVERFQFRLDKKGRIIEQR